MDVHDYEDVFFRVTANVDPKRDVLITEGPLDHLDHAPGRQFYGGKIGIDCWCVEHVAYLQVRDDGPTRPQARRRKGTGLGLQIIETLVKADLGGSFELKHDAQWTRAIVSFTPAELEDAE